MKHTENYSEFGFGTRAIHAGQSPEPITGAVMTPVFMTSTYHKAHPGNIKATSTSELIIQLVLLTKTASLHLKTLSMLGVLLGTGHNRCHSAHTTDWGSRGLL